MTAVDVDALDKLREALARKLTTWVIGVAHENAWNCADVLVELPEVVDLLAEVRRGWALREAVEGLAGELDEKPHTVSPIVPRVDISRRLRAALAALDPT